MTKLTVVIVLSLFPLCNPAVAGADLIIHNGRIVTVDAEFSIQQAMAVEGNRIVRVGDDDRVLELRTEDTQVLDLNGRTVLPGFIDSHVHPTGACLTEFDHPIGQMDSIADVLDYFRARAEALEKGRWIVLNQVFITRLLEQRYPTKDELDAAAPANPVVFRTGPDASLNSLALELSNIDRDFKVTDGGPGHIEKDPATGEPTGILRGCNRHIKSTDSAAKPTDDQRYQRLRQLFKDYNKTGITSICDGSATQSDLELFERLLDNEELTVRVAGQHYIGTIGQMDDITAEIRKVAGHKLFRDDPMLRITGIKVFLDGGMLTGSAYMNRPWGVSSIYAIDDPEYRGVLFIEKDRLLPMVRTASECGLQFTAHCVGDGAVDTLLDVYEQLSRTMAIDQMRHCITHSNFMSAEAVEKMARLQVIPLVQPAWLYLDTRTLVKHFGYDRLRYFQPLQSIYNAGGIVAGGSDHMQKIGSVRSINPYDPFLGMWTAVTRRAKWYDGQLHREQALSRRQAIRMYTIDAAYAILADKYVGSLEAGKLADFVVIDTDLLECPEDQLKQATVLRTYHNGELVFATDL